MPSFAFSIASSNLFTHLGLLLFSIIHLGVGAIVFLSIRVFYLGAAIGWFGNFPDSSTLDGIMAYMPHSIFEFPATFVMATASFWISLALVRPDEESSRMESVKRRYQRVLKLVPLIVILLVVGAIIESTISVPNAFSSAQKAVTSEERRVFSNSQAHWQIEVPVSWKERDLGRASNSNLSITTIEAENFPVFMSVMTYRQNGLSSLSDIRKLFEGNDLRDQFSQMGLSAINSVEESSIGEKQAIKVTGTGTISQPINQQVSTTAFFIVEPIYGTNTTSIYGIFVWVTPKWNGFYSLLFERILNTFEII